MPGWPASSSHTIPSAPGGPVTEPAFTDAVLADLDRAAAVGADEMHISLNLGTPVPPDRQPELLAALAAARGTTAPGSG